jgi:hypothetical protein
MIRRLTDLPRRAASALVSAVVIVTTLGQPPEGALPEPKTTDRKPKGGRNA